MTDVPPPFTGFTSDRAKTYDERVRKHIPGYPVMHAVVETALGLELPAEASILAVGAGTGQEILEWAPKHPGWRFVATDKAPAMLEMAQQKCAAAGIAERVRCHAGDLQTLSDDNFDAATLLLVLHFVPVTEQLEMLTAIAERLKPGAPFVIANLFGEIDTTRFKRLNDGRKAWAVAQGLTPEMAQQFCDPTREDMHIVPEEQIKRLLRDAGFIDVQRVYQAFTVGVWTARTQR